MEKAVPDLLRELTMEEKTSLLSGADFWHLKGIDRLGIPSIMLADGPHGLRKQAGESDHAGILASLPATCFPTASATASSWNRALLRSMGEALGEECLQEGVSVILGPGVNMKRSPLCGRNFEYFSEDPFLAGEMAVAWIDGVQGKGIGTSLKHFAANNQEGRRMTIDVIVDARSLRELYLPAFEAAVKRAKPWTVMCAYNRLSGHYCSENGWLLTEVLREEWGFEGVLVTDWGACNDRFLGLVCGQDLEMPYPGPRNDRECLLELARSPGRRECLDRAASRLLALIARSEAAKKKGFTYDAAAHHALARQIASESMVLLKNEDGILPLAKESRIALIGDFADHPRYQGAGSSLINPTRLDTTRGEIAAWSSSVVYAQGYVQSTDLPDEALLEEAVKAARGAEVALVYVGLTASYETEGADRSHLRLPASHDRLVEAVAAANPNTVVVLQNGSAVAMPWLGKVKAVLEGFLAGQAAAGAALDILFGKACPSGKLAESYPVALEDLAASACFPEGPLTVEYREGLFIGYRWFDASGRKPLFPFGFGLSYTSFEYSDLALSSDRFRQGESLRARVTVRNSGKVAGAEVVQLYVRDVESTVFRPAKELKGFEKVALGPGEKATVEFALDARSFAYWDAELGDWYVESGDFELLVASSSADIRLRALVKAEASDTAHRPVDRRGDLHSYYELSPAFRPTDAEFAALLGRALPAKEADPRLRWSLNSTLGDVSGNWLGRRLRKVVLGVASQGLGGDDAGLVRMAEAMVGDLPLRDLCALSGGKLGYGMVKFLLAAMNIGRKKDVAAR